MLSHEIKASRERLLTRGAEHLSDAELLSLIFNSTRIARALCHRHNGDWHKLGRHDLLSVPHFTPSRAAQVLCLVELCRRIHTTPLLRGDALRCSEQVAAAYAPRLAGQVQEVFIALALDNKHRVIAEHEIARGGMVHVQVDPRTLFRQLLKDGAAAAITVHNHPGGDPTPSADDIQMCERLVESGRMLGMRVVDFVIVGTEASVSFADQGLIP